VSSSLSTRAIKKDKMKIGAYIKDSFDELLNKVTWPTWEELQSSAVVVAIASLIIALIIFAMDQVFSNLMQLFYDFF
jgi:preprotein translocase subunit SecE|tara:strand:+ start:929 stop:1159 length:231 start_codon:yes stop_codon:yes gene_type:complete